METSILIAKIIGIVYTALGVGLIINKKYYKETFKKMISNTSFLFMGGLFAIIIGVLIIEHHNYWKNDWTVLITIIGWVAIIKGILLIVFPKSFSIFKPFFSSKLLYLIFGPFMIIIGIVFLYFGFFS